MHATDCPTATEMNSVCSAQRPATPRRRGRQPEPHTKHTLDCGSVYTKFKGRRVSLSRPGWWWLHKHSLYNPSSNCLCFNTLFCLQEVEPKTNTKLPSTHAGEQGLVPRRCPGQRETFRGRSLQGSARHLPITCSPCIPLSSDLLGQGSTGGDGRPWEPASLGLEGCRARPAAGRQQCGASPAGPADSPLDTPPGATQERPALQGFQPEQALVLEKAFTNPRLGARNLPWKGTWSSPQ